MRRTEVGNGGDSPSKALDDPGIAARAVLVGKALIGFVSCFSMDGQDHVGYWIDRVYWELGIASQSLHLLLREVAKRLLVATAASNGASLWVLQKCGFVVEQVRLSPACDRYPECEKAVLVLRSAPPRRILDSNLLLLLTDQLERLIDDLLGLIPLARLHRRADLLH